MAYKIKRDNTKIIANALLKGLAEYVWLKTAAGKSIRVLKETLHKDERKTYYYEKIQIHHD